MPLPLEQVSIAALTPASCGVSIPNLNTLSTLQNLPPVEVVSWPDEGELLHLLVDGTHRAYLALRNNQSTIAAKRATLDEHIPELSSPALAGCRTIADVRRRYQSLWLPHYLAAGVRRVSDLPESPRPLYREVLEW